MPTRGPMLASVKSVCDCHKAQRDVHGAYIRGKPLLRFELCTVNDGVELDHTGPACQAGDAEAAFKRGTR